MQLHPLNPHRHFRLCPPQDSLLHRADCLCLVRAVLWSPETLLLQVVSTKQCHVFDVGLSGGSLFTSAWLLPPGRAPGIRCCMLSQWVGAPRVRFRAAGRNNLINAIRLHGGFQVVADILQRERLFTRRPAVTDRGVILRKVRRVQQTLGLPPDEFPTREQFEACQMPHVVGWITTAGGFRKVRLLYHCSMRGTWCLWTGIYSAIPTSSRAMTQRLHVAVYQGS